MIRKRLLEKIERNVFERTSWVQAKKTNLYVQIEALKKDQVIQARHQKIPINRESIMIFADDAPLYNWAHPCRYLLYDAKSGEFYDEVKASFPPYLVKSPETFKAFYRPVDFTPEAVWPGKILTEWAKRVRVLWKVYYGERYAILFSGASNNRHVNDLEFIYRVLTDVYGFSSDHIYVLNYDGTINYGGGPAVGNWPGDNTAYRMPVNGSGTKSDFETVFNDLKGRIKRHDMLYIHTNNHGGHNGTESYLCTYSGPDYLASDFGSKLSELPSFAQLFVMMEQCHSGGFKDSILNNSPADETTFAAACREDRSSIGGAEFDPFARDWISAVNNNDPYGGALDYDPDTNNDSRVSAQEAFNYAEDIKDPYDTPVYDESPAGCGIDMYLGQLDLAYILGIVQKYLRLYRARIREPFPPPPPELGPIYLYDEIVKRLGEIHKMIAQR